MYISRRISPKGYTYRLCESYFDAPYFKSKVLVDLGHNPEKFINYYSDVAFTINLEEVLLNVGKKTDQFELEELFLPFLRPEARYWVNFSLNRKTKLTKNVPYQVEDIHWFDRVRMISLKLDHRDPYRIVNKKFPFFKALLNKSRDEIENYLWNMEDRLTFRERLTYILTIFSLQNVFSQEERDQLFLDNLCKIAQDPQYYLYQSPSEVLSSYLARYVWLYFDYIPYRRTPKIYEVLERESLLEISRILNISFENLVTASKKEIIKAFRRKLLEVHPDKGGSHEEFLRIRRLMERFIKTRF